MSDSKKPSDKKKGTVDDQRAEHNKQELTKKSAPNTQGVFESPEDQDSLNNLQDIDLILDIPVKLTVELGRTKMTIKELLRLSQGSVVALDGLAGEPLDILINGYLIAQGEVVVVGDKFGVRITDIITPSEHMGRLSR
ncbi:flagellar motor switch protein FliN [Serratia symbiotica]|uniref:flagellar motor switch protein FliN n=1 Tax=Serratia symbiotica TaxID=138074 RepID=UPI001DCC346E|nr:flagellar motor switch protein FliN [Serratia symbiotica]NIG88368.1 flagellar motor switch protein FliN [Serratia symbiotica]USS96331.1 flagellar motor switch protein FliN [Serratia symbiotica]